MFKHIYPQEYLKDEPNHIRAFLNSFSSTNQNWLAKIFFVKELTDFLNYQLAEEVINYFAEAFDREDP